MIELNDITKIYNPKKHNQYTALKGITLSVKKGEFVAITGRSGSGKSTLLHIIGLLDGFSSGNYLFEGNETGNLKENKSSKLRAKKIGFVKQDFALIDSYSVIDNIMLPMYAIRAADKKKKAMLAIDRIGISHLAKKEVSQLSGGEKQRVAIARAIVNKPSLLLADEPTGSLDTKTAGEIMQLFHKLNDRGMTIIIVTHDMDVANECSRIVKIENGKLIES